MATRRATKKTEAAPPHGMPPAFTPGAPGIPEPSVGPSLDGPAIGPPPAPPPAADPRDRPIKKRTPRKKTTKAGPPPLKVTGVETDIAPDLTRAHLKIMFSDGNFGPFDIYALTPEVQIRAAVFGIEQKIRKARDPVATGKAIATGTWPEGRARGVNAKIPLVVRAVARLTGVTDAEAYTRWQSLPDEGPNSKKAIRLDQRVKGAIAQIKAETDESGVDMGALFAGKTAAT